MTHEIRVVSFPDLIQVIVRDELDLAISRRILAEIAATSLAHPGHPILVDTRAADTTMSVMDVYQLATELAESGVSHRTRLAVLNRPDQDFNRAAFLEQLGQNRGLHFRHFHDYQQTIDWLTGT